MEHTVVRLHGRREWGPSRFARECARQTGSRRTAVAPAKRTPKLAGGMPGQPRTSRSEGHGREPAGFKGFPVGHPSCKRALAACAAGLATDSSRARVRGAQRDSGTVANRRWEVTQEVSYGARLLKVGYSTQLQADRFHLGARSGAEHNDGGSR